MVFFSRVLIVSDDLITLVLVFCQHFNEVVSVHGTVLRYLSWGEDLGHAISDVSIRLSMHIAAASTGAS